MAEAEEDLSWSRSWWGWFLIWMISLAGCAVAALILGAKGVHPWTDVAADRIRSYQSEQCEPIDTGGFFVQKANFWSNFAYLWAGLMVLLLNNAWIGRYVGLAFVFLAITSGWYHGTLAAFGQTLDIMGVYVATLALFSYGLFACMNTSEMKLRPDDPIGFFLHTTGFGLGIVAAVYRSDTYFFDYKIFESTRLSFSLGGALFLLMAVSFFVNKCGGRWVLLMYLGLAAYAFMQLSVYFMFREGNNFFAIIMLLGCMLLILLVIVFRFEAGDGSGWRLFLFLLSLLTMGGAVIFKFTDGDHKLDDSKTMFSQDDCVYGTGWLQGHALWHLLSGVTFVLVFEFFRTLNQSRSVLLWVGALWRWIQGLFGGKKTAPVAR